MDEEYAKYLLEKTKEDYNLIAEDFARTREKPWPELKFLFDNYLVAGEKVLDLGCGNGCYFEFFQEKGIDYFGIDFSEKLIEIAKEKYPRARFLVANALNLPFPDNYFDKVYSLAVFHHIPSEKFRLKFLKETKRVLKPEGLLILTVWGANRLEEKYLTFKYLILKLIGKSRLDFRDVFKPWNGKINRYYHFFSKSELTNLLKKSDFLIKESGFFQRKDHQNIYLIAKK